MAQKIDYKELLRVYQECFDRGDAPCMSPDLMVCPLGTLRYIVGQSKEETRDDILKVVNSGLPDDVGVTVTTDGIWVHGGDDGEKRARANEDLLDIVRSDAMLLVTYKDSTSGGFHVELGAAQMKSVMGSTMPIYLLGPKRNVFMYSNLISDPPYEWGIAAERIFGKVAE